MGRPKKEVSEEKFERFQKELEMAGDNVDILLKDKRGRSTACLLCRRRKQKCDHMLPSCTACLKAGVKCVQPSRYGAVQDSDNNDDVGPRNQDIEVHGAFLNSKEEMVQPNRNIPLPEQATFNNKWMNDQGIAVPTIHYPSNSQSMVDTRIPVIPKTSFPRTISEPTIPEEKNPTNLVSHAFVMNPKQIPTPLSSLSHDPSPPDTASIEDTPAIKKRQKKMKKVNESNGLSSTRKPKENKKDRYTLFLERKLNHLEQLIQLPAGGAAFQKKLSKYKMVGHLMGDVGDLDDLESIQNINNTTSNNTVQNIPNILPLPASASLSTSNKQLPFHHFGSIIPPSTGVGNVSSFVNQNSNPYHNQNTNMIPVLSSDSLDSVDYSNCIFAKYNLKEFFNYDPAFEFDEQLSRSFLDTFFTRLQFKYPLLDEKEIYNFHNHYTTNDIHSYSKFHFHFASGRMWLVFSISACLHMTTGKYKGLPPFRYFSTAVRHIARCENKLNDVQKVEVLTLLILYIVRTDRDSLVLYEIIKDVMDICQNKLSLNTWNPQDPFANKRLRLFWCVYLLERMICVAVGKPYTIKESDINLPLFNENSFNTKENSKQQGVHFINQSLKLRRIESKFVEILQILPIGVKSAATVRQKQLPLVKTFFRDLELWRASCSVDDVKNYENETLKLYYYRSVRLLIQPYLEFLTPDDRLFRECQAAAGQICQLYKIFHQKTVFGHSTPAVHTVFVAGVTLIYCMWLARNFDDERRKNLGDYSKHTRPLISASLFSTMDDLRACSVCLYVMTERSKFARVFRDTFDQLMNATVGNLIERCGPDSAELIHLTSGKYDVETLEGNSKTRALVENNQIPENNKVDSLVKTSNGLPPAIARVFGKRQADEHVGFVENSQVDLEEQKKFKKRQGLLEKTSVPKSLADLLVKSEGESNTIEQEKITSLRTETVSNTEFDAQNLRNQNSYVIKKPLNQSESDWQLFQKQAVMQQQLAQQNLQAYLSTLQHSGTNTSIQSQQQLNSYIAPSASDYAVLTNNQCITNAHSSQHTDSSTTGNQTLHNIAQSFNASFGKSDIPNGYCISKPQLHKEGKIAVMPSTSRSFPIQQNTSSVGDILFSNGTHEMINNISTWTNNAITDSMGKLYVPVSSHTSRPGQNDPQRQNRSQQENSYATQISTSYYSNTNNNGQNFPARDGQGNSIPYQRPSENNLNTHLKNPQLARELKNGNLTDLPSSQVNHQNLSKVSNNDWETHVSAPAAEEFWTVNDDYGFLT
ncbi:uncharacterized protein NDAI_0I01940 [Naumovozyma dairenensis CBS 421]|uniref:Zn(2)-C6 fungal-type domain-containing protein n=1 Tax=Naumovozyma dairenensis (strain ATCC 10597 / BCRC 20456 / CBS 421 / NBRC 0211 / NRRL Y-12639) TaxID=1071378 RepID=G0WG52_NAUDC|nr:hypothetical protein NDAI_0I01940 [Naumovozyma dairenensis CBS 421]CCD26763.1 hypothetical protein NDAI_0I01940 [Naumovozyma dairenensis CBS 421]